MMVELTVSCRGFIVVFAPQELGCPVAFLHHSCPIAVRIPSRGGLPTVTQACVFGRKLSFLTRFQLV